MTGPQKKLSLYERLGEQTLERAVYLFYDKVLADDRLKHFFKNHDTKILVHHQYLFLQRATGGPDRYEGRSLRAAHRKLVINEGLNNSHFDAVMENLQKTLEELGVGYSTIQEIMGIVAATRDEVLNR